MRWPRSEPPLTAQGHGARHRPQGRRRENPPSCSGAGPTKQGGPALGRCLCSARKTPQAGSASFSLGHPGTHPAPSCSPRETWPHRATSQELRGVPCAPPTPCPPPPRCRGRGPHRPGAGLYPNVRARRGGRKNLTPLQNGPKTPAENRRNGSRSGAARAPVRQQRGIEQRAAHPPGGPEAASAAAPGCAGVPGPRCAQNQPGRQVLPAAELARPTTRHRHDKHRAPGPGAHPRGSAGAPGMSMG